MNYPLSALLAQAMATRPEPIPDHARCRSCSGTGLLTDNAAYQRQTCTIDDDCPTCEGTGRGETT